MKKFVACQRTRQTDRQSKYYKASANVTLKNFAVQKDRRGSGKR